MRFELPEARRLVLTTTLPIRWGDMDAMGHVNNTVYFRYFEIVRIEWLTQVGALPAPSGQGPVIVNAFCNFHRQLAFPGEVRASLFVGQAGRSSFDTHVVIERADEPGVWFASGGSKVVWTDTVAQKALALPDWLRQHLD
ncbi:MAG: acyl-CoA thioesterase [Leptothrix sp. (in: b-proteobacteria)]